MKFLHIASALLAVAAAGCCTLSVPGTPETATSLNGFRASVTCNTIWTARTAAAGLTRPQQDSGIGRERGPDLCESGGVLCHARCAEGGATERNLAWPAMRDDMQGVHVPQRERGEDICDLLQGVAIGPEHDQRGARFEAGDKARQIGNL